MSSRKKFIHQSSLLMGGSLLASTLDSKAFAIFKNRVAPSDQLNIGAIGINGMGWANVKAALKVPGVNLVAVCDVDSNVIKNRLGELPSNKYNISLRTGKKLTWDKERGRFTDEEVNAAYLLKQYHNGYSLPKI